MFLPLVWAFLRIFLILRNTSIRYSTVTRTASSPCSPSSSPVVSTRVVLLVGQALLFLVCLALTLAWYLSAPFQLTVYRIDPLRPSLNVHECATDGWKTFGVTIATLLLMVLLLVIGISWSIRRVQDVRFRRFRIVLIVSFVWGLFLAVIALLQSTASNSVEPTFLFGMRSLLLLLSNLVYVLLMFAAPLYDAVDAAAAAATSPQVRQRLPVSPRMPSVQLAESHVDNRIPMHQHLALSAGTGATGAVVIHAENSEHMAKAVCPLEWY